MAKKKFYVVWAGYQPGIYEDWTSAQQQISGFSGAKFKSYPTRLAAEAALKSGPESSPPASQAVKKSTKSSSSALPPRIPNSLSVDAACSGNPGKMEYQGVITGDGRQIFHQAFPLGTNNIGEFLAIVHALALLQRQERTETAIYTDSKIAMGWVKKKKCKTTLVRNAKTEKLYEFIERAETWLKNNTYSNPIYKWPTKTWGEIPADFGRK